MPRMQAGVAVRQRMLMLEGSANMCVCVNPESEGICVNFRLDWLKENRTCMSMVVCYIRAGS